MRSDAGWDQEVEGQTDAGDVYSDGLDVLAQYAPDVSSHSEDHRETGCSADLPHDNGERPEAWFTVTSPTGALSATATIGGRLQRIDVFDLSDFDEVRLGQEIKELATLAKHKARAAQREVIVDLMRNLGHDRAGTGAYLQHALGVPSWEDFNAQLAEAFAARRQLGTG